ncbi:hypothetical protein [Stenotrophomonas sp. CFBP8980]|uniref:hypothetical protein n=1 Tax=Stenotrophomonas sp. CFBP8980 TaxID=3096523 RepID=UPI002A6AB476|nr:hypothetical protein [Stenotrophomonas sp. CFBP8980]MDY1033404.1 hypothetical protein [Stenotrophomonas sp. CFBP8980]
MNAAQTKPAADGTPNELFAALRGLLLAYQSELSVVHDEAGHFYANCRKLDAKGKAQFFGAVKVSGRKHSFHFMPVYDFPELLAGLSPDLKKHMQGKSCFNFTSSDPAVLRELQGLVEQGASRYKAVGKL